MKMLALIIKSLKEQYRSFWVLLLTVSMGPFFIFIYYLIIESTEIHYDILLLNDDAGFIQDSQTVNYGNDLLSYLENSHLELGAIPFSVKACSDRNKAVEALKNKHADALIILDSGFTKALRTQAENPAAPSAKVEYVGDLTNTNYFISAVWANELMTEFVLEMTGSKRVLTVSETALGQSASLGDFEMMVPGLLIISLIMLMFPASIAFVAEVEHKTMLRLKLSRLSAGEFLFGISFVQLWIGLLSIFLTLLVALALGFTIHGSLWLMILIAALTSLSIIAFSLIIAAFTKSANEVLVVGNFPMFLFMFFTGAAFPMNGKALFSIAGYPVNLQGLMSPTHAISALNKTLVMNLGLTDILGEIAALLILTMLYFLIGGFFFRKSHLKLI
jgi:ABC-2 type transport system permease protein